ncbi:Ig-like domain-containing protein, partial [Belliella sp. DSM 107340]
AFVWNDAPLGNHVISARTTDDNGSTASSTEINILVIERPNNSPEITITAPSDNDQFFVGDPINIAANAVDADGSITKVEFFAGNNLLATDTQAPFAFVWNDAPLGNHVISARTTDDNGSTASSTEINILVIERPNNSPEITITAPSDNDQFFVGDPINIAANAVDADGSITKVEFFAGNYLLATDTQAPFAFVWNDAPLGNHVISARTTDDNGSTASSTEINILVIERPNNAPTVNITAPLTNTKFNKGDEIVIEVNAQDTDGTIAKVEFFYGNMFLGSDLTAPYSFNWTNAPAGKHIITAKAIDNKSVAINSSPISIEVIEHQRSPSVRIVSPIANNEYFKNDILPLNVEIPEESSEIIKVDYFRNNIFIGSRSGENLSYNWEISVTGSVNITAIATDIEGKTASDARSIRVVDRPNQLPSVQITSPSDDSTFSPDEQITIVADASDNDGHVVMVEFFQGNLLIGKSEASPYRINWNNPPLGNFSISARATDDKGGKTFSAPINILVKEDNSLPKIELLTPIDNQSFEFDETVELIAMFKGDAKNVKMVEYYANSELIASSSLAPFSSKWENTRPGTYNITAKAIGNIPTNFEVSEISRITVKNEPVFRIISPTQLSEHQKGSALSIEVETPTSTKTIDKVEFYNGNKLIGTSKDQPYSFVFENVPLGETTLISRLVYTDGTALFSFPVRIIGKNKPVVKIEASNGKTSFAVGDSVLIKPEFVDFQNPISQVEYFINGISKGIYKTSPFAHSLENMPHGEHEIWIEAIDDEGNKYVSEKLFINVSEIAREGEINLVDFKIGPNPTNRFLNLIFDNIQEEHHISAAVVSMNGSTVRVFDFVLNENEVTLDLEGLTAGTYLLRIQYQGKIIITKRFIKVN